MYWVCVIVHIDLAQEYNSFFTPSRYRYYTLDVLFYVLRLIRNDDDDDAEISNSLKTFVQCEYGPFESHLHNTVPKYMFILSTHDDGGC